MMRLVMKLHVVCSTLALAAAVTSFAVPAAAADLGNLEAYALAPVGNIPQHGLDYALGYKVAQLGPVRLAPLVDVSSLAGNATFHLGAAATVGVGKHVDVGVAEVQRPGSTGFTRLSTAAVVGVRL
jgi:hypothetical protein